jgi:hypothetical protein
MTQPDIPHYEHPDRCGEDMSPPEEQEERPTHNEGNAPRKKREHFLFRPNSKQFRAFVFNRLVAIELAKIAKEEAR